MYKVRLDEETKERIKSGDTALMIKYLRLSDEHVVNELKQKKCSDDIRFLQGASHIIDTLLRILEVPR